MTPDYHAVMQLPVLMPDLTVQRFDCHACTNCCRELVVHLTARDIERIDRHDWTGRLDGPPYVRLGHEVVLNHRPAGGCVFLQGDGKCLLHAEFGPYEKPLACQLYPFTLEPQSQGVRVGIRFDCPSVAQNKGRPLSMHAVEVRRLAGHLHAQMQAHFERSPRPIHLRPDRDLSESECSHLLRCLDDWLRRDDLSLEHRVAGLARLAETLDAAKLRDVRDERFAELIDLLMSELPDTVPVGTDLPDATPRQRKLLRQTVFSYSEHITLTQARAGFFASFAYRLDQLRRARRLAAGRGAAPRLGFQAVTAGGADLSAVEKIKPDAALPANDADDLVTRRLRAVVCSRAFFGSAYYGWPLTAGLDALVLSVAAIGWLTRFLAADRRRWTFELQDVLRAVQIVDRNAGRARELGARSSRLRQSYLRADHGLFRLIHAYPILPPQD